MIKPSPKTLPSQSLHDIKSSILKFNLGCALVRLVQFQIELCGSMEIVWRF
nr:MAG TPA: hypothetical protein [Caudoviricetes sp.]